MKIYEIQKHQVNQVQSEQTAAVRSSPENEPPHKSKPVGKDTVELSAESRLMQKAGQVIAQAPEVRPEKIQAIAEAVQNNTYQVDSRKVANSIIASIIIER